MIIITATLRYINSTLGTVYQDIDDVPFAEILTVLDVMQDELDRREVQ